MIAAAPRENPLLIGHEGAERAIVEAMAGGRLPHAWLITGAEGVGKATLAYRFARRLFAGGGGGLEMAPGEAVFRRVAAGSHADLLTVERVWDEKKKRLKKQIAAEDAREIPGFLHLTPAEGGWRVVIVDGAEDLSIASANALLKVFEEPPGRSVLMLVCSAPGRLLPTIRSRCRHLSLAALDEAAMGRVLEIYRPDLDEAARRRLIALAEGSPGRALALAEQGGLALAEVVEDLLGSLPGVSPLRGYEIADQLREPPALELFFGLLQGAIGAAITGTLRGTADAAQRRLAGLRPLQDWAGVLAGLARIARETEAHNLDRRQAVVAALTFLH